MTINITKLPGILALLLCLGMTNAFAKDEVASKDMFFVDVLQADNADINAAKDIKTTMSFSGKLKFTKKISFVIPAPNSKMVSTHKNVHAVTFKKGKIHNAITQSGDCGDIKQKNKDIDAFKMTILGSPTQNNIEVHYSYAEDGPKRKVTSGKCTYLMPSNSMSEAVNTFNLGQNEEIILDAGKINDHFIFFKILRATENIPRPWNAD